MKITFGKEAIAKLKEGVEKLEYLFNDKDGRYYRRDEINRFAFNNIDKFKERYNKKVIKHTDGCWGWVGARHNEYPMVCYKIAVGAHRISYIIANGKISENKIIMHLCDNPICSNPKHLKLGTTSENVGYIYEENKPEYNKNFDEDSIVRLSVDITLLIHREIKKLALNKNITIKKWVTRAIAGQMKKELSYITQDKE